MCCELVVASPVGGPVVPVVPVVVPVVSVVAPVLGKPLLSKIGEPPILGQEQDKEHGQDGGLEPKVLDQLVVAREDEGGGDPGDPGQDGEQGGGPDGLRLPVVLCCGS